MGGEGACDGLGVSLVTPMMPVLGRYLTFLSEECCEEASQLIRLCFLLAATKLPTPPSFRAVCI